MSSKKCIAFVANTSWSIFKFRLYLLQTLAAKGFEVHVLSPRDKYTAHFEQIPGIHYVELKKLRSKSLSVLDDIQLYFELLGHYKRIRPALIFHYTIKANIYGSIAARRINCPAIAVITGLGYAFSGRNMLQTAASYLYRYALKKTKEVWFLNADDREVFIKERIVEAQRTFILAGEGVDSKAFYASPYEQTDKPISFLLIARLIEHKGIYEFAHAAGMLLPKGMQMRFNLLGFSDDKSAVTIPRAQLARWQSTEVIHYLGETDNVVPFIDAADCIVLPSYREGMPLSLLEGASMCKALIATDVAGCREVVKDNVNGYLCNPKDAASLAAAMEKYYRLSASEKKAMGIAGRAIVTERYTQEIVADVYLRKLEAFLGSGR